MNKFLKIGLIFFLLTWLFVGIYRDDEWNYPYIFFKYKPSFLVNFSSPIGMSDMKITDLEIGEQIKQNRYDDFVIKNKPNSEYFNLIPFVLIQLTLTLLTIGITNVNQKFWKVIVHFLINVIPTVMGIAFLLTFDKTFTTIIIMSIILCINFLTNFLLNKFWKLKLLKTN